MDYQPPPPPSHPILKFVHFNLLTLESYLSKTAVNLLDSGTWKKLHTINQGYFGQILTSNDHHRY